MHWVRGSTPSKKAQRGGRGGTREEGGRKEKRERRERRKGKEGERKGEECRKEWGRGGKTGRKSIVTELILSLRPSGNLSFLLPGIT